MRFYIIFLTLPYFVFANLNDFNAKIFVAGHRGLVGNAVVNKLKEKGYQNIITACSKDLDLRDKGAVKDFFQKEKPEYVFLAAAKVGGILANNNFPAEFIYDNLAIELNVIDQSYRSGVKKLLFFGSSCIYPRLCPQPIKEEYLLTSELEPTNKPYAIAKIAGIELCKSYRRQYGFNAICCMPTNLYGPNDNFDLNNSHVMPALIRKYIEAKEKNLPYVEMWGTGSALREFLYIDDLADASIFLMENYSEEEIVNIGTGKDISIYDLALMIKEETGFEGEIRRDLTKPDGTPKKQLNIDKLEALGFTPKTSLRDGIKKTVAWYKENK